ncbi:MAG: hypothetical protein AB7N76_05340 [Planctomycetota bacterium]
MAVVLDRSASLRWADPEGEGLRALAQALALALRDGERLALVADPSARAEPAPADPSALVARLRAVLAATPRPGGAHLQPLLERACELAGGAGVVVVYGDDDLDVVARDGSAPAEVLAAARAKEPRPARDAVNQAARELLRGALAGRRPRARIVGLVAPLPAGGRTTPFLQAIGARRIALGPEAAAALATAIRGAPVVGERVEVPAGQGALELSYPARVTLAAQEPLRLSAGAQLDEAGRLWLVDGERVALPARTRPLVALVAPRLPAPAGLLAYRLRDGTVRVQATAAPAAGALVARSGEQRARLAGTPPVGTLSGVAPEAREVEVALTLGAGGAEVEGARARVPVVPALVEVTVVGEAQVGTELRLEATLPPGLPREGLELELRDATGRAEVIALTRAGQDVRGRYVPRAAGALALRARGSVDARLRQAVEVKPAPAYQLALRELQAKAQAQGQPDVALDLTHPLQLDAEGRATLKLTVAIEPRPPAPVRVALKLAGIEGAALGDAQGAPFETVEVRDPVTLDLVVAVPAATDGEPRALALEASGKGVQPTSAPLPFVPARGLVRVAVAAGLLAMALLWSLLLWRARRQEQVFVKVELANKQLRTVGQNGRLSPECYLLRQHLVSEEEGIWVQPDDSPGGALMLRVREDGKVDCEAREGARLIHQDRPTVLADRLVLEHGTAFAMVSGQRALRYVYLADDPSAEELSVRWLEGDGMSQEEEMRDSGVFVLLDDHQTIPKASARLEASTEMLALSGEMRRRRGSEEGSGSSSGTASSAGFESSEDVRLVPPSDSGRAPLVSDEGIVYMNSDEGAILDSEDVDFLEDTDVEGVRPTASTSRGGDEDEGDIPPAASGGEISMDDLL